ncbi:hypothetical protein [Chryseobacterium sediminis]|uniref:Uncharacterized protein n=1 Tax=Chryseobacterium sediminis TaxID=1679494 RepID=A0A5B2U9E7_9FLAO|nr:hypothetical protein [Chryseobacterium sediminis]KAA2223053.1 hypothetical protein FW780_02275 [Chryseobacterium sediminis]
MKTDYIIKEMKAFSPCKEGFEKAYKDTSLKSLCELFFANSDWALKQNFPSKEVLGKYRGYYEKYGVYYRQNTISKAVNLAIFDSESEIEFTGFDVSEIFIRGKSKITIKASGYSKIFVTVLDDSELNIERIGNAEVFIYQYGGVVNGDCVVKQKRWD